MPQDYKHRAQPKGPSRRSGPCWLWFFSGVTIGLFAAGLTWLKLAPGRQVAAAPIPGFSQKTAKDRAPQSANAAPRPRFDFYTILPEMEVVIPESEMEPEAPPAPFKRAEKVPQTEGKGEAYLLQVGSFRSHADADRLKARLALLGMETEIQKVTINNRETYHRVRAGPFRSRAAVNDIRSRLKDNGINSIVIKLKG